MLDALAKSPASSASLACSSACSSGEGPMGPTSRSTEALDLAFRLGAHEAVDRLPLVEGEHGRNRLDAELLRDLRVLVDVDLDQRHLAAGVSDRLLQNRRELLAGAAPGRPEVDDHRRLLRRLDHVGGKALGRRVLRLRGAAGRLANEGYPYPHAPGWRGFGWARATWQLAPGLASLPPVLASVPCGSTGRDHPRPAHAIIPCGNAASGCRGKGRAAAREANGAPL